MRYEGFIGGTYVGRSVTPGGDRCINFYLESTKGAGSPENTFGLLSTPGTNLFVTLPTNPIQQLYADPVSGQLFVIAGKVLYAVYSDATVKTYGPVDEGPYSFASNGLDSNDNNQVMLACAGSSSGYIIAPTPPNIGPIYNKIVAAGFLGCTKVVMIDNYFITLVPNSRQFQISSLGDGTQWDALDVGFAEGGPENLVGIIADHRELWLLGSQHAEIFADTGAALFPFERINSIHIEQGLAALDGISQLDSTIYWISQNQHGQARILRNDGYTPIGVSNRSVEWFFNMYAKNGGITDAKLFGYQDEDGHSFLVCTFPSATSEISATGGVVNGVVNGATWVYDVSENQWHERQYLDPKTNKVGKAISTFHAFLYNKHLVGGGDTTGNVYELSIDIYTDNSNPITRIRRAPHIIDELKVLRHKQFRLNAQVGAIPIDASDDSVALRVSNDGGLTWSNQYIKSLGNAGEYMKTITWRGLGRSQQRRAYEVATSVNAPVCLVDAYLDIDPGTK